MSDVINLVKLKCNKECVSLAELSQEAQERFKSLDLLVGSEWEQSEWSYLKRSKKLKFQAIGGGDLSFELATLCKVFLVDILWNKRLRPEPYVHSYICDLLNPFKIWNEMKLDRLTDINQDSYDATIVYLRDRYEDSVSPGISLNKVINYLNEKNLLNTPIDTVNIRKVLGNTDEQGRGLANNNKMPLPQLVKAVIQLKWAVDDNFDGSAKAISDKLCILTQAFQYGLGLRLGEVLRLPKDPLIEIDGETFCLVWTEKGSTPLARYVPSIWRKPLTDAVAEIHKLTKHYRDISVEIEHQGALGFLNERIEALNQEKDAWLSKKIVELDEFLVSKKHVATEFWQLKKAVNTGTRYELQDLENIIPIASSSTDAYSLFKYYKNMGLDIISEPLGIRQKKHFVTAESILQVIDSYILKRASYVTQKEFLTLLNPCRSELVKRTKDKLIQTKIERLYGHSNYVTFTDQTMLKQGSHVSVISRENAISIFNTFAKGGYDNSRYLTLKDLEDLLPELLNQKSASKEYVKKFCGGKKVSFYRRVNEGPWFKKSKGYLADIEEVKKFFLAEYERMNLDIDKEILNVIINDYKSDGVEISSKSFTIKQQPSEYLFIRAGMRGGVYFDYMPQILGYHAVRYFFAGNDRQENAFTRYGVSVDSHVAESWQSHKGRHWQTTSLFRAGLAEMVVNKWMGRTTGNEESYDHNTGRERAKVIADVMLEDTERFLGDVPNKVRQWKNKSIPVSSMPDHLTNTMHSIQYSPLGYCTRSLFLKPCEFNLKCLTGNDGKGCKHYIYDLYDPSHREKIAAERDKSSLELSRLFEVYENGLQAAKMHIDHHRVIVRNTTSILEKAEIILNNEQLEDIEEYMPFKEEGSYPDDCPFQCGDDEK